MTAIEKFKKRVTGIHSSSGVSINEIPLHINEARKLRQEIEELESRCEKLREEIKKRDDIIFSLKNRKISVSNNYDGGKF